MVRWEELLLNLEWSLTRKICRCRVQIISRVFGENHVLMFRKTIMQTVLALISVHEDQYMALYCRAESQGEF
jgi:hypothetical protein